MSLTSFGKQIEKLNFAAVMLYVTQYDSEEKQNAIIAQIGCSPHELKLSKCISESGKVYGSETVMVDMEQDFYFYLGHDAMFTFERWWTRSERQDEEDMYDSLCKCFKMNMKSFKSMMIRNM